LKRTLVLLHGLASNATRWSELAATTTLGEHWNLVRPDLRGFEQSPQRGRIGMREWCDDLAALLEAAGCERAVIGGHCLGANIALQFAARHPGRTAGLVLIEPMPRECLAGAMRRLAPMRGVLALAALAVRAANALGLYRRRIERLDLEALDRAARAGTLPMSRYAAPLADLRSTATGAYLQGLVAVLEPLPDARRIEAPALVLLAKNSRMTDTARVRRSMSRLREARIVELDAVHWIPTEQPVAMRRAIEDWLERRFAN
jgi:pimeloyl-ACP methyl ester carboxylesterase